MDCSTFQNHGKGLFLLKNKNMTIHGNHFSLFLPSASLVSIIYGSPYGKCLFLKINEKMKIWYYGSLFFA